MRTIVTVDGMRAVHCVRAVQTALAMVPGIAWCDVTVGTVELEHDGSANVERLREALAMVGFTLAAVRDERRPPIVGGS
jgi:copper chaperone CopZ